MDRGRRDLFFCLKKEDLAAFLKALSTTFDGSLGRRRRVGLTMDETLLLFVQIT
jgi:hypothetical protein